MTIDRYTKKPWASAYEEGGWNRDGGNFDSLNIMVKMLHHVLGSEIATDLNRYASLKLRDGELTYDKVVIHDYGCGEGDGTMFLKAVFPAAEVVGYDNWPAAITNCKVRWGNRDVKWEVGDVTEPTEKADLIFSTCTIDHVDEIGETIERLRDYGTWVIVNWGLVFDPAHPSQDLSWVEDVDEPFWSKEYLQPRVSSEQLIVDRFHVFVWRGR